MSVTVKLLAKMPEERYQTAAGVENDLCHCLADWKRRQCIDDCPWAKMMKESETLSKLLAAFFPKAEESTLGRILVEAVILLSMRTEADSARLLRDAAQAYKVTPTSSTPQYLDFTTCGPAAMDDIQVSKSSLWIRRRDGIS